MSMQFFNLCMNNKLADAKQLLDENIDLGFTDPGGRTALAMAAGRGHIDVVNWLIEIGSPTETKDNDGRTALGRAASMGHLPVVDALTDAGADINAVNKDSRSILSDAIANKKEAVADFLIQHGARLGSIDDFGKTALHHAVQNGLFYIVKLLIENGAAVDPADKYKNTPAYYAQQSNRRDLIELLQEAEQNQFRPVQSEAVEQAVSQSEAVTTAQTEPLLPGDAQEAAVASPESELLNQEETVPHVDGITNLKTAIEKDNADMVKYYISQGEDINETFSDPWSADTSTLFSLAIGRGNPDIVKLFIDSGIDVNERFFGKDGLYKDDYMIKAINYEKTQIIKMLLEAGFDTTDIPSAEGRKYYNCHYVGKLLGAYCFHNKTNELAGLLPMFFEADILFDLESLHSLKRYDLGDKQLSYYKMIVNRCMDINEVDISGRTILHNALKDFKNTFQFQTEPTPAAENSDDLFIDALLDCDGIDVNSSDYSDNPPLYYACKYTTDRIVRKMLQMGADITALCGEKSTPLALVACEAKKLDILKVLCEFGAYINVHNDNGFSLLHTACLEQDMEFITYLVENGADVSATDSNGNTPLHILVTQMGPATIKSIDLLLQNGAGISAVNGAIRTPFFVSCCTTDSQFTCRTIPVLKHLVSLGAVVDSQDISESTPLHYAVIDGDITRVKFLLDNGADSNIQNNKGESAYKVALNENKRAIVSMIEKADVSLAMDGDDLDAAFMRACKNGRRGVAEMLVKSGNIDVTYVDDMGRTPLHYIAKMGMTALGKFLIENGVDVNYTDNKNQTALHFAAGNLQKEIFKLLLENGADLNIADDNGVLPIHLITNRGQHDMLRMLLQKGADIGTMTNEGQSLLHVACYTRGRECVRVLLDEGINPNILDRTGVTPLIISVNINQKEIVKLLAAAGADIHSKDLDGDEAIHIAAMRGFKDMLALLLTLGSDVNTLNNRGLSPLHLAAYFGYKDIFKFLLDNGADFDIKTGAGKSCIDIASENGQKELIELIGIMQKRRQAMGNA